MTRKWIRLKASAGVDVRDKLSASLEGQMFLGYPTLALMSQRAEYQNMVKTIADDMTRKWIRLKASAGVDKSAKIKRIEDKLEALKARDVFKQAIMNDGYYGRRHVDIDPEELVSNLGFGARSATTAGKMPGKKIVNLRPIEPMWCCPRAYESPAWYVPQTWNVVTTGAGHTGDRQGPGGLQERRDAGHGARSDRRQAHIPLVKRTGISPIGRNASRAPGKAPWAKF